MKRRVLITSAVLVVAACSPNSESMSDELKKDLDIAASSDGLSLASSSGQTQQVVSAIEQSPPAPKKIAASQRAVRHRRVETAPPAQVEAESGSPSAETEPQSLTDSPVATEDAPPVAPRPTPVVSSMPGGSGGSGGGRMGDGVGVSTGVIIGTVMGVVLRGGAVGEDRCEEHERRGRSRPTIAINTRIPVIRGTFPSR